MVTGPSETPGNIHDGGFRQTGLQPAGGPPSAGRLIAIPLAVFAVWVVETFFLEGSLGVFTRYQPFVYVVYVIVANILVGTFAPVIILKSGFLSGAVNMYQAGIRSPRRTLITAGMTAGSGYLLLVSLTPYSASPAELIGYVLILLPVAIASVMVCWVLTGTHIQAYVRQCGAIVSIITSVSVTGVLFGISFVAHSPPFNDPRYILGAIGIGAATAVVFFAIRDIWSAIIFNALALSWLYRAMVDPAYVAPVSLPVILAAALSILALVAAIRYLTKRFITIRLPPQVSTS